MAIAMDRISFGLIFQDIFTSLNLQKKVYYKEDIIEKNVEEKFRDNLLNTPDKNGKTRHKHAKKSTKQEEEKNAELKQQFQQKTYLENDVGSILDLISTCLEYEPSKRPSIQAIQKSLIFELDSYSKINA